MIANMLGRWLDIKPRLTVVAALLAAISDALAFAAMPQWLSALCVITLMAFTFWIFWFARRWRVGMVLCFLSACMYGLACWSALRRDGVCGLGKSGDRICMRGIVSRCMRTGSSDVRLFVAPCSAAPYGEKTSGAAKREIPESALPAGRARSLLLVRLRNSPATKELIFACDNGKSAIVELSGRLRKLPTAHFPWDFDARSYYSREGVNGSLAVNSGRQLRVVSMAERNNDTAAGDCMDGIRQRMVKTHQNALGAENGALLSSMVIGDADVKPDAQIREQFRALGLSHLIAASGFNLTVVVAVAFWSVRFFVRSARLIAVWCCGCIIFYCLLAGFSPSVERAALMCSVALWALTLRRSVYLPACISAALLLTLFLYPQSLADAGLQLSYAATFAIAFAAPSLKKLLCELVHCPGWLADVVSVVFVANAAVLPLQMIYFWQVGQLSLVANTLVSPLVAPITILGFVSSAMAGISNPIAETIAVCIDIVNGWPLCLMMAIVAWLSSYQWSVVRVSAPPAFPVIAYYVVLIFWMWHVRETTKPKRGMLFLLLSTVCFVAAATMLFLRPKLAGPTVIFMRESMLLALPDGTALLVGNCRDRSVGKAMLVCGVRRLAAVPFAPAVMHDFLPPLHAGSMVLQMQGTQCRQIQDVSQLFRYGCDSRCR